jgi:hypothetical protein
VCRRERDTAEEEVSEQLPIYAWETSPVVRELVGALKGLNEGALARLLMPESEAEWAFRLFGMGPLLFLLFMHLEGEEFVMPRFARCGPEEVLVEVGWVTGVDEEGRARYDPRRVSTVRLQRHEDGWRISDVSPGPLDRHISMLEAHELLARAMHEGRHAEPLGFPWGVLTGAFQLKRMGREPLDQVETLFVKGMERSEFGVPEIIRAVRLWREFKERGSPTYRRPEVYAAAVEYVMTLFGFCGDSQVQIAERYGVSPSSVSSKWQEMERALSLSQFDRRYSVHEDPGAGLEAMLRQQGVEPPPPMPLGTGRGVRTYDMRVR